MHSYKRMLRTASRMAFSVLLVAPSQSPATLFVQCCGCAQSNRHSTRGNPRRIGAHKRIRRSCGDRHAAGQSPALPGQINLGNNIRTFSPVNAKEDTLSGRRSVLATGSSTSNPSSASWNRGSSTGMSGSGAHDTIASAAALAEWQHTLSVEQVSTLTAEAVAALVHPESLLSTLTQNASVNEGVGSEAHFGSPCEAFQYLTEHALPVLFTAAQEAQQHDSMETYATWARSDPAQLYAMTRAVECLSEVLQYVVKGSRETGRRYERAFPAPVVAALWMNVVGPLFLLDTALLDTYKEVARTAAATSATEMDTQPQPPLQQKGGNGDASITSSNNSNACPEGIVEGLMCTLPSSGGMTPAATTVSRSMERRWRKAFQLSRRALALRTCELVDLLPPDVLVLVIARMQNSGALSDDVLGPVATQLLQPSFYNYLSSTGAIAATASSPSSQSVVASTVARNHLLLSRLVLVPCAAEEGLSFQPFHGASAIGFARVLGRQSAPMHFQLHKVMHRLLLPSVRHELRVAAAALARAKEESDVAKTQLLGESNSVTGGKDVVEAAAAAATKSKAALATLPLPPQDVLVDLTRSFVRYAVSGEAVEDLCALWAPYIEHFTVAECLYLLKVLTPPDHHTGRLGRGGATQRISQAADEEYLSLVALVCTQLARSCHSQLLLRLHSTESGHERQELGIGTATTADCDAMQPSAVGATAEDLCGVIIALMKVDCVHWAETYTIIATALVSSLMYQAQELSYREGTEHTAAAVAALTTTMMDLVLPVKTANALVLALLRRNTMIPDHPLHTLLLKRLLHSSEALNDVAVASTVLCGLEAMVAPAEGTTEDSTGTVSSAEVSSRGDSSESNTLVSSSIALDLLAERDITPDDRFTAFKLFRRHGSKLRPPAFVAGMCATPLSKLPVKSQTHVINYFTSIVSSVSPALAVKGMAAALHKVPSAVDPISAKQWFSRFTAIDVVRQLPLDRCADLLDCLAMRPEYGINSAIAKSTVVRRVGTLLRAEDTTESILEVLPRLVPALRASHVSFAFLFSRMCRVLLAEVEKAPVEVLLPAFSSVADEFVSRSSSEAHGSVFPDVWELLRARVMENAAAELTELPHALLALNAFAVLDCGDRPLFLVLVHRLCTLLGEELVLRNDDDEVQKRGERGRTDDDVVVTHTVPSGADQEEDTQQQQQQQQVSARLASAVGAALSPSAVAALTNTLLYMRSGPHVRLVLPWALQTLKKVAADLYPNDVVLVLPGLLRAFADAEQQQQVNQLGQNSEDTMWAGDALHAQLLHSAYDSCRSMFLLMYGVIASREGEAAEASDTVTPAAATTMAAVLSGAMELTSEVVTSHRQTWSRETAASVRAIPSHRFVPILTLLSECGLCDTQVAVACATQVCTGRQCQGVLQIGQVTDVMLALCFQFVTPPSLSTSPPEGENGEAPVVNAASSIEGREEEEEEMEDVTRSAISPSSAGEYIRVVLNALWARTEELDRVHVQALLRCLGYYFGERVDVDFVERLRGQQAMLLEREAAKAQVKEQLEQDTLQGEKSTKSTTYGDAAKQAGKSPAQRVAAQRRSSGDSFATAPLPLLETSEELLTAEGLESLLMGDGE